MEWQEAEVKTIRIIRDCLGVPESRSILLSDSLENDLTADSLDLISILMKIERDLGVEIPDNEAPLEKLQTVRDIVSVFFQYA